MRYTALVAICSLLAFCFGSSAALAQSATPAATPKAQPSSAKKEYPEDGRWSVRSGMGFTASPSSFLLGFEGDYRFNHNLSSGFRMELGMKKALTIVSPQGYLRYTFDGSAGELGPFDLGRLRPFVQAGMGLTHYDTSGPDDTAFLMSLSTGVEYWLNAKLSLASQMYFNFLPGRALGDVFYYSWEMASVKLRF